MARILGILLAILIAALTVVCGGNDLQKKTEDNSEFEKWTTDNSEIWPGYDSELVKWCEDNSELVDALFKDFETRGIIVSINGNTVIYTIDVSNYLEEREEPYSEEELGIIVDQNLDKGDVMETFVPATEALGRLSEISNISTEVVAKYKDKIIVSYGVINDDSSEGPGSNTELVKWFDANSELVNEIFIIFEAEGISISVYGNTVIYTIDISNYLEDKDATYSDEELGIIVGQYFDKGTVVNIFGPATEEIENLSGISNLNTQVDAKYKDEIIESWNFDY